MSMMKNRKYRSLWFNALLIACFFIPNISLGLEISGYALALAGKSITVQAQLDFISDERITLGNATIEENGHFHLDFPSTGLSPDIHVFYLRSGNLEGVFYGNKDGQYEIEIPSLDKNIPQKFDQSEIPIIWKKGSDATHILALRFYKTLDQFVDEHYYDFAVEKFQGHEEQRVRLKNESSDMVPKATVSRDSLHLESFRHKDSESSRLCQSL